MSGEVVRVDHRGLSFDVLVEGPTDGPGVVLLHGFPQDASSWDRVVGRLVAAGCRTIRFDQRGYASGARPAAPSDYRMHHLVGDVLAVLGALDVSPVHVVGHDWGGAVAWALSVREPSVVASLTVVSTPHPIALGLALTTPGQVLRSWYVAVFRTPVAERLVLPALPWLLARWGLAPERAAHAAARMAEPGALTGALNWYRAMPFGVRPPSGDGGGAGSAEMAVTVPTTYVWGRDDPMLGPVAALSTGDHVVGDYRFAPVAAGHWLPEELPDTVAGLVLDRIGRGA